LSDALGVDDDEVVPEATLQGDLGAESIDFLDIVFRLEKAFAIKIPKGELFPDDVMNNPDYIENDRMTPVGMEKLKAAMPHVDFSQFEQTPDVSKMPDLFTVNAIVNYVESKLAAA
jgi:acyl carrier protein